MKLPHLVTTSLIWLSSEHFITIQALIFCRDILCHTGGLLLLNMYGPHIWRWIYVIPSIVLICASVITTNMIPFSNLSSQRTLYIASHVCSSSAFIIIIFFSIQWFYNLYLKIKIKTHSQRDIMCSINLISLMLLLLGTYINTVAQGQHGWVDNLQSYYITSTTLCSTYEIFVAVFNMEQLLLEILANTVSNHILCNLLVLNRILFSIRQMKKFK